MQSGNANSRHLTGSEVQVFYYFSKLHLFAEQRISVFAMNYPDAREQAKRIAGSGFLLFLVSVQS